MSSRPRSSACLPSDSRALSSSRSTAEKPRSGASGGRGGQYKQAPRPLELRRSTAALENPTHDGSRARVRWRGAPEELSSRGERRRPSRELKARGKVPSSRARARLSGSVAAASPSMRRLLSPHDRDADPGDYSELRRSSSQERTSALQSIPARSLGSPESGARRGRFAQRRPGRHGQPVVAYESMPSSRRVPVRMLTPRARAGSRPCDPPRAGTAFGGPTDLGTL